MTPPREPTAKECSELTALGDDCFALWYPQMGGYGAKAVVQILNPGDPGGCIDVWVWHDGEFPFTDHTVDDATGMARSPARLHHCDAEQFRRLADDIAMIAKRVSA